MKDPCIPGHRLKFETLEAIPSDQIATLFRECFAEYIVPIAVDATSRIQRLIDAEDVRLELSLQVVVDGDPTAIALVAERGLQRRLAAMAVRPDHRHRGIGGVLLRRLLENAISSNISQYSLEVIETNKPAVQLYQKAGFVAYQRLLGYTRPAAVAEPHKALVERPSGEILEMFSEDTDYHLPWSVNLTTLKKAASDLVAYQLGPAYALVEQKDDQIIRFLYVEPSARKKRWASRLLRALPEAGGGRSTRTSAFVPETVSANLFTKNGYKRDSLNQLEMVIASDSQSG